MNNIPEIKTLEDLKNFLAYNKIEEKWRNCKRKKYNIYACKMSEGFIFANCLEQGAFYKYLKEQFGRAIVLKEQVSFDDIRNKFGLIPNETLYSSGKGKIVLCGTRGELWTVKEEKLASSYTNVDGSPIDLSKLKEDKWFEVSRAQEDEPHAKGVFIPSNFSFKYNAWGQILTINDRYSKGHYKGDIFVVETDANGNLNWNGSKSPTNSEAFSLTYDLTVGGWAQTGLLKKVEEIEPYNTKNIQEDYPIYTKEERANIINEKHKQIEEEKKQKYLDCYKRRYNTIAIELANLRELFYRFISNQDIDQVEFNNLITNKIFSKISFSIFEDIIKEKQIKKIEDIPLAVHCLVICAMLYSINNHKNKYPSFFLRDNITLVSDNLYDYNDILTFEKVQFYLGLYTLDSNMDENNPLFCLSLLDDRVIGGTTDLSKDCMQIDIRYLVPNIDALSNLLISAKQNNVSYILNTPFYKKIDELVVKYLETEPNDICRQIKLLIHNLGNKGFREKSNKKFQYNSTESVFTLTNDTYNIQFRALYNAENSKGVEDSKGVTIQYKILDIINRIVVKENEIFIPSTNISVGIRNLNSDILGTIQK